MKYRITFKDSEWPYLAKAVVQGKRRLGWRSIRSFYLYEDGLAKAHAFIKELGSLDGVR